MHEVACACRELAEECGLSATRESMHQVGIIFFHYPHDSSITILEVSVFVVDFANCTGAVVESEEMTPIQWFPFENLPLDKMWADDEFWLPKLVRSCNASNLGLTKFRFASMYVFAGFEHIIGSAMLEWEDS